LASATVVAAVPTNRLGSVPVIDIELEHRVVDLELRFMRLERDAQALSDIVIEQQRVIDALVREIKRRPLAPDDDAPNEPPPHY
jgi:uncharacterized coiled-coil protein SlyX